MNAPFRRISRRSLAGAAVLALAGCASLFVAGAPGHLYRLTAADAFPPNLPVVKSQLVVDLPQAPAGIDSSRIALSRSPLSIDYYADAEWTDRVPAMVQTVLLESFENSKAITAVDRASAGSRPDVVLESEIRHFEAVYERDRTPPTARVTIVARLVAMPRRQIVAQTVFERRVPAAANNVPDVVAALDAAADAVMHEIVLWTIANPALSSPRR